MLYRRAGLQLIIKQQHDEKDMVEGYVNTLKKRFPGVEVVIARKRLRRPKHTLTFKTIDDAVAAEELIDND